MKKVVAVVLAVCLMMALTACGQGDGNSAKDLAVKLQKQNVVVTDITESPAGDGYVSRANFTVSGDNLGAIETFKDAESLQARVKEANEAFNAMPNFAETLVINGNYLLRLERKVPQEEVDKYKNAFMAIK